MCFIADLPRIVALLCLPLFIAGCAETGSSGGAAAADWKEYSVEATEQHDGYRIHYPKDWILDTMPDGFGAVLSPAQGSDAALIVSRAAKVRTPMEVARSIETLQKMGTPNAETAISPALLSGHEAARIDVMNIRISQGSFVPQVAAMPGQEGTPGRMAEIVADGPMSRFNMSYTVLEGDRETQEVFELVLERFSME